MIEANYELKCEHLENRKFAKDLFVNIVGCFNSCSPGHSGFYLKLHSSSVYFTVIMKLCELATNMVCRV